MARGPMPAWVPAIIGLVLVVAVGAPLVERRLNGGRGTGAPSSTAGIADTDPGTPPPVPADLPPIRFAEEKLGAAPVSRFAFDRSRAGHVEACEGESQDGGRSWTATPSAAGGRLCGDALLAALPGVTGAVSASTQASDGTAYAAVGEPGRRPHLLWAPAVDGPWRTVATPGDVRALAADGARIYAVADMLGRGQRDAWDWTRWPPNVTIRGVDALGATVVAWGTVRGDARGGYVVSRDGGVRLQTVIHGPRPAWAALDPHRPGELLVLGDDGSLTRLQIPPG